MSAKELIFAQLMELLPRHEFNACVKRYRGDHRLRRFSCRDQFRCMAFAQLTFRESLRDIETCLRSLEPKLYRAGFRSRVSRSTLADANRLRDWRIYFDLTQILIAEARALYADEPIGIDLKHTAYALDATTIDLCLALFPWAPSVRSKAAIKLHTLLDLRGNIPTFIRISTGKMHEVRVLDELPVERGAFYVMDKAYIDFKRLYRMHCRRRSSSRGTSGTMRSHASRAGRWTRRRACAATRRSGSAAHRRWRSIRHQCGECRSSMPTNAGNSCSSRITLTCRRFPLRFCTDAVGTSNSSPSG